MKKISVFLLLVLMLTMLAMPAFAAESADNATTPPSMTAPPMPTFGASLSDSNSSAIPENTGSIIGITLAGTVIVAIAVISIIKKRK